MMEKRRAPDKPSRSSSPEKRTAMLRTLRASRSSQKFPMSKRNDISHARPQAAATAASQAWEAHGSFDGIEKRGSCNYRNSQNFDKSSEVNASQLSSHQTPSLYTMRTRQSTSGDTGISEQSYNPHHHAKFNQSTEHNVKLSGKIKVGNIKDPFIAREQVIPARKEARETIVGTETLGMQLPTKIFNNVQAVNGREISNQTNNLMNHTSYMNTVANPRKETLDHAILDKSSIKQSSRLELESYVNIDPEQGRSEAEKRLSWENRRYQILQNLPPGVDKNPAAQILDEVVVHGDEVRWSDVAGLDNAKRTLKEAVVYPFLRPDLFFGLREPARGILLFGPPGTGKTMLARAVATEAKSTFFSISSSTLTSKYLGDSEKLVRALFAMAKKLAPSVIFVDEIDSLLAARSDTGEQEASRRIKTEFLIQWSALTRARAGKETALNNTTGIGDERVLILAATNLPWTIDAAARRRFSRRQYIPLPEAHVRATHLRMLLQHQKHDLNERTYEALVRLTNGYSGSDLTELAKDAAMGPLRSAGDKVLQMKKDDIRSIHFADFQESLKKIKPSVNVESLERYEEWAKQYGERGE